VLTKLKHFRNILKTTKVNWKLVGKIAYGVISALILGVGMCLIMVWSMMLLGILIGVVGIVMLLCLIPMIVGFKEEKEENEEK
jgi:membrane protein YdbS with pleckstrin-like domain